MKYLIALTLVLLAVSALITITPQQYPDAAASATRQLATLIGVCVGALIYLVILNRRDRSGIE